MFRLTPYARGQVSRRSNDFSDIFSMFDDVFNDSLFQSRALNNGSFKIDIKDNDQEYILEADLPGVKKEDLRIDYKDDQLLIQVECKDEMDEEKSNYIHRERRVCSMQRMFGLKDIQGDQISAKLENGVLTIVAPKREEVDNSIRIEVK
ncbi:MAG: Hsp20/alpha crystallin family protein [Vallitaleaceae bacterium]|nr:Hsp20/alpha crystallin family protein [Vallitaleaceae bacterium]